ncbi:MAG: glycosyl transferase [Saprospiraceae bacterium]|nr:glycosyl transferase [Saprospiraceae bacterium]
MKILYAIQGTGNGHLSRARDIVPILSKLGQLDILVSGIQADVAFPFPVKYRFKGLSLIFGKKGGVDVLATYQKSNLRQLLEEINGLPVEDYHLVINDFEPVSAWACFNKGVPCIGLSHQAAVLDKKAPKPKRLDPIGKATLKHYAPVTTRYGFHFQAYNEGIFTPVIRQEIRQLKVSDQGHYTVYLPAYADKRILKVLSQFEAVRWVVFSKHGKGRYSVGNVSFQPINNEAFLGSLAGATGVLCGAGFETPAETLYLGKKLMVIPMKGQYEQQCNAAALKKMGVPVIKSLRKKYCEVIEEWLSDPSIVLADYPDQTEAILRMVVEKHAAKATLAGAAVSPKISGVKDFKKLTRWKILAEIAERNLPVTGALKRVLRKRKDKK